MHIYANWIERELHSFGLQTFAHYFPCANNNKKYKILYNSTCVNIIAELQAPRGSGKEAIYLTTPFIEET